jgi:ribosomal protein S18 acetylase RimI-like enzyme
MAGHGVMDLLYGELIAGKSTVETIVDRRILRPDGFAALEHWRVAEDPDHGILGALNSFPHRLLVDASADRLLDDSRLRSLANLSALEATASDTYYINILAVLPERRRRGTGGFLMAEAERLARRGEFSTMSLCTFEADLGLLAFYRRLGFAIQGRSPIQPHPLLEFSGDWVLMTRRLAG